VSRAIARHFLIVGHGLRGAELFHFDAERHNHVLLVLRQRVEGLRPPPPVSENLQHWKYPEPSGIHNSCHEPTYAVQQSLLMMFQRRLSCVGWIGSHHFLRSVHNSW
jgi:hypothetical protein